jgi:hypothetical protein
MLGKLAFILLCLVLQTQPVMAETEAAGLTCKNYLAAISISNHDLPQKISDIQLSEQTSRSDDFHKQVGILLGTDPSWAVYAAFLMRSKFLLHPTTTIAAAHALVVASQSMHPYVGWAATSPIYNQNSLNELATKIDEEQDPKNRKKFQASSQLLQKFLSSSRALDHLLWVQEQSIRSLAKGHPEQKTQIESLLSLYQEKDDKHFISEDEARALFLSIEAPLNTEANRSDIESETPLKFFLNPEVSTPLFALDAEQEFMWKARLWATVKLRTMEFYARSHPSTSMIAKVPTEDEIQQAGRITKKIGQLGEVAAKNAARSFGWNDAREDSRISAARYLLEIHRRNCDARDFATIRLFEAILDTHLAS